MWKKRMRILQAQTHLLAPSDAFFFAHSSAYVYIVNIRLYHSVIAVRLRYYLEALVQVQVIKSHRLVCRSVLASGCDITSFISHTHTRIYLLLLLWDVLSCGLNFHTRKEGEGGGGLKGFIGEFS